MENNQKAFNLPFSQNLPIILIGNLSVEPLRAAGIIEEALTQVKDKLTEFIASPTLATDLQTVFGQSTDIPWARTLLDGLPVSDELPQITLVSAELMNGAVGGFDSLTGTVYLADSLINPNSVITSDTEASPHLVNVIIEELGHWLDSQLNQVDTPGDEGEWLAALVQGDGLSASEIARLRSETDQVVVTLEDQTVILEQSAKPTFKGRYDTPGWAVDVQVAGYAYLTDDSSGLQIIDISNPTNPTLKSSYDTPGKALDVEVVGKYAYLADGNSGLQIIDISNPTNPTFKGSYDTPGGAVNVQVAGKYAYLADFDSGLQIIDISNPTNPTFKGSYDTPGSAQGLQVAGKYAYLADGNSGLQIIDISNPTNPTFKGSYDTPDLAWGLQVVGKYAYLADNGSGLQIIDISNPTNPIFKGNYDTSGITMDVQVAGKYAYMADGDSGLQIIDVSDFTQPSKDDLNQAKLSIKDTQIVEGDDGKKQAKFTVTLSSKVNQKVEVNYATTNGTAKVGEDYQRTNGKLTFKPGETSKTINVPVFGDTKLEGNETFKLLLSQPKNAKLGKKQAIGSITNDDLTKISIKDTQIIEGDDGKKQAKFTVSLNTKVNQKVEVSYATSDGTAKVGEDYQRTNGKLTFQPNQTQKTIIVPILGDTLDEDNETFFLNLSKPKNADLGDKRAIGKITDNDTGGDKPGDSFKTAVNLGKVKQEISRNDQIGFTEGVIRDTDDYYGLQLDRKGTLVLVLDGLFKDANIDLYGSEKELISQSNQKGISSESIKTPLAPGTYYVRVYPQNSARTDYRLSIDLI